MAKKKETQANFFQRLTRLFRRGRLVKKKIRGYDNTVAVADKSKSSGMLLLQKSASTTYSTITGNAYNIAERLSRYQDFAEMEYCLAGDTLIAVPGGFRRIDELARECKSNPNHTFEVYSFDHVKKKIVKSIGKEARQTRIEQTYAVYFDNGKKIVGSPNHRLMLRDGTYCRIDELKKGDAMMPFYRSTDSLKIYTMNTATSDGWELESSIESVEKVRDSSRHFSGLSFGTFLEASENVQFDVRQLAKKLDKEISVIGAFVQTVGFDTYASFAEAYKKKHNENNFRFANLCNCFMPGMGMKNITNLQSVSESDVEKAAVSGGFTSFDHFKRFYRNLKVARVEKLGIIPLYDLTVDGYKNFCTDTVVSHNTPEIAAALDIYADETCLSGDSIIPLLNGKKLTVKDLVDTDQQNFWVYSFDTEQNKIVPGLAKKVYKTGTKKLFKIRLNDGSFLRLTDNHRVLLSSNEYVRVDQLKQGDSLRSLYARQSESLQGINLSECHLLFVETNHTVISIEDDGYEDVYDLEVEQWHNFAVTADKLSDSYVFVHNCAQDDKGKVLHVFSENEKIKEVLDDLFYDVLDVDYRMRSWVRNLVKHGDFFMYNDVHPEMGVVGTFPIPVNEVEREENYDPEDPLAVRFRWVSAGNRTLENWEISHFRLLGNDMFLPYGSSIIEPARRIWRQLVLAEDAMLVYRIVRAPERRVIYVDVGNIAPDNVKDYMEEQRKNLRASSVIDSQTGRVDLRSSTMSIEEDLLIPVRGSDSGTKIDPLPGGQNTAAVEDVAYIQKKLFAAIKIPRAYLGYDEALSSKATLAQEDIRFSRTIAVIQKTILSELNKIAIIHLFTLGFKDEDLQNFQLRLSNPSTLAQQQKLELWRSKFELAGTAPEKFTSRSFVQREIWGLTKTQIDDIDGERFREKQVDDQIENGSGDDAGGAGGEDLFGGGESPDESGGSDDAGGDAGGEDLFASDDPLDKYPDLNLIEDDEVDVKFSLDELDKPVKPKSGIEKYKYDRSRIRHHGASKTHMPDFKKMLSRDQIDKDPYGNDFLKSMVSNPLGEASNSMRSSGEKYRTRIDVCTKRMLEKMVRVTKKESGSSVILEEIDYVIDEDSDV